MKIWQKTLGHFNYGCIALELVVREGGGAEFWFHPEHGKPPRIKIGLDCDWPELLGNFLHELFEFGHSYNGSRFAPDGADRGSDCYRFMFDHNMFSRVCVEAGIFCSEAVPELSKAYHKRKSKTKGKKSEGSASLQGAAGLHRAATKR